MVHQFTSDPKIAYPGVGGSILAHGSLVICVTRTICRAATRFALLPSCSPVFIAHCDVDRDLLYMTDARVAK
jgi:hypothetical protein